MDKYLCRVCGHNGHYSGYSGITGIGICYSWEPKKQNICYCSKLIKTNLDYLEKKYDEKQVN